MSSVRLPPIATLYGVSYVIAVPFSTAVQNFRSIAVWAYLSTCTSLPAGLGTEPRAPYTFLIKSCGAEHTSIPDTHRDTAHPPTQRTHTPECESRRQTPAVQRAQTPRGGKGKKRQRGKKGRTSRKGAKKQWGHQGGKKSKVGVGGTTKGRPITLSSWSARSRATPAPTPGRASCEAIRRRVTEAAQPRMNNSAAGSRVGRPSSAGAQPKLSRSCSRRAAPGAGLPGRQSPAASSPARAAHGGRGGQGGVSRCERAGGGRRAAGGGTSISTRIF